MQVYEQTNVGVAAVKASQSFNKDKIRKHLAKRMAALFKRTEEAQETLINQYQAVAYADANELMEYRREACRFCYGDGHKYQYTPQQWRNRQDEYEKAKAEADAANEPIGPLDPEGGVGFDPRREPHPDCPECFGEGRERLVFKDTRHLSPAGLALYTGAKVTKDGIEIKTRSQERAAEMLARILKLYEEKTEVNFNFSADELEETYVARMQKARERMQAVIAERGGKS
jgi:phage terminase small subunit